MCVYHVPTTVINVFYVFLHYSHQKPTSTFLDKQVTFKGAIKLHNLRFKLELTWPKVDFLNISYHINIILYHREASNLRISFWVMVGTPHLSRTGRPLIIVPWLTGQFLSKLLKSMHSKGVHLLQLILYGFWSGFLLWEIFAVSSRSIPVPPYSWPSYWSTSPSCWL